MSVASLTWRQVKSHYLNIVGNASEATTEFLDHATGAHREMCSREEVEELFTERELIVPVGKDRVSIPEDLYAVYYVFNVTDGERVEPEEHGMRGRSRYLQETTGIPPEGKVYRWARSDRMLYLRDAASAATTLLVRYKRVPPDVTDKMLDERPLTPPHLDWPLVHLTAAGFLDTHPRMAEDGSMVSGGYYRDLAYNRATVAMPPQHQENRDRREGVRLQGYDGFDFGRF